MRKKQSILNIKPGGTNSNQCASKCSDLQVPLETLFHIVNIKQSTWHSNFAL